MKIYDIYVIYKDGRTIYREEFAKSNLDPILISGFIRALEEFAQEAIPSEDSIDFIEKGKTKIVLSKGKIISVALICELGRDERKEDVKNKLNNLIQLIEKKYENELYRWDGSIKKFSGIDKIIKRYLIKPEKIKSIPPVSVLNSMGKEYIYSVDEIGFKIYNIFYRNSRSLKILLDIFGLEIDKLDELVKLLHNKQLNSKDICEKIALPAETTIILLRDLGLRDIVNIYGGYD